MTIDFEKAGSKSHFGEIITGVRFMKIKNTSTVIFLLAIFLLLALPAFAGQVRSAAFMVGQAEYIVDDVMPVKTDAAPFVEQGRVFVPLRYLARALGVADDKVSWSPSANTVTLITDKATITLAVGGTVMYVGEQPREMDVAPVLRDGRVYLPARYVAEALEYEVGWDDANQLVYCWPKGGTKPDVSRAVELFKDWVWLDNGFKIPDPDGRLAYRDSWLRDYLFRTYAGLSMKRYPGDSGDVFLSINITPLDGKWVDPYDPNKWGPGSEEGYRQAEVILASRFGKELATEVMAFAGQKKYLKDDFGEKEFHTRDGKRLVVLAHPKWKVVINIELQKID